MNCLRKIKGSNYHAIYSYIQEKVGSCLSEGRECEVNLLMDSILFNTEAFTRLVYDRGHCEYFDFLRGWRQGSKKVFYDLK